MYVFVCVYVCICMYRNCVCVSICMYTNFVCKYLCLRVCMCEYVDMSTHSHSGNAWASLYLCVLFQTVYMKRVFDACHAGAAVWHAFDYPLRLDYTLGESSSTTSRPFKTPMKYDVMWREGVTWHGLHHMWMASLWCNAVQCKPHVSPTCNLS